MNTGTIWSWCWIGLFYAGLCGALGLAAHFAWLEYNGFAPARVLHVRAILLKRRLHRFSARAWSIARRPKTRAIIKGALAIAIVAVCGWAIWPHASSWFAAPHVQPRPMQPYAPPSGLPLESAIESLATGMSGLFQVFGGLLLVVGMALVIRGAGTGAMALMFSGMLFLTMPMAFRMCLEFVSQQ
jgi:hypothetical protein